MHGNMNVKCVCVINCDQCTVTSTPTMIRQTQVRNKKGEINVIFRDE
jgi:hypothetical protein